MLLNAIIYLSVILQAGQVLGHGFVAQVDIAGRSYKGFAPFEGGRRTDSIVRQIANTQPVKGSWNPDLVCGRQAANADQIADVNPGETVSFHWKGAGHTAWPHNAGPILTYMASCGSTPCNKFNPAGARWFKISNLVKKSNGEWFQADVQRGIPMNVQIPSSLAPGNYLIRQEIIALHLATQKGGHEHYPSCTQLRVGGHQTGRPAEKDLVNIPGAYYDDHPGLWVKNLWEHGLKYQVPGPAVATIGAGPSNDAPQPSQSEPKPEPTPEPKPEPSPEPKPEPKPTSKPAPSYSTTTTTSTSTSTSTRTVTQSPSPVLPSPVTPPKPTDSPKAKSTESLVLPMATINPDNFAPPPSSPATSAPALAPETPKLCSRKRSSLKYMQAKLAKRSAAPDPMISAPLRSRHSRRAMMARHGSH